GLLVWSPDSRFIAYNDNGKLKKISISGGPPQTICDLPGGFVGGTWNQEGTILYATNRGLVRVSANSSSSCQPVPVYNLQSGAGVALPFFLPDGRHFLYLRGNANGSSSALYVGSLDAAPDAQSSQPLLASNSNAEFIPTSGNSGKLLYERDGT